jgi:hypothetical protein
MLIDFIFIDGVGNNAFESMWSNIETGKRPLISASILTPTLISLIRMNNG